MQTKVYKKKKQAHSQPQSKKSKSSKPTFLGNQATKVAIKEVTSLKTKKFSPSKKIREMVLDDAVLLPVSFGKVAKGDIKVKQNEDKSFSTVDKKQYINLNLSHLSFLKEQSMSPILVVEIDKGTISGYISVKVKNKPLIGSSHFMNTIYKNKNLLGLDGIKLPKKSTFTNRLENQKLLFLIEQMPVSVDGFADGLLKLSLTEKSLTFAVDSTLNISNFNQTKISIKKDKEEKVSGKTKLAINLENFSGEIDASFVDGVFDIAGVVSFYTTKLNGEIHIIVADAKSVKNMVLGELNSTGVKKEKQKESSSNKRAMAGWGEVDFSFTDWMSGKAKVIIDDAGHITIHGEITPPKEVELFSQQDYVKNILDVEARMLYGIPVLGNVFVFVGAGLDALAKIGPAKLYNIKVLGTYSTDPKVYNDFSLEASLNMSMYAGLRLSVRGGAGVEILAHDIKLGIRAYALGGIKGYLDATPKIGFKELSDPKKGKKGEFFIEGYAELATQPFLDLGGEFYIELATPFWSPLDDGKETFPLGSFSYPLPTQFGIGADMHYVIGSSEFPKVEFSKVGFDATKFTSDLVNDHIPSKTKHPTEKEATFSKEKPKPKSVKIKPKKKSSKPKKRKSTKKPKLNINGYEKGISKLKSISRKSRKNPLSQKETLDKIKSIEQKYKLSVVNKFENNSYLIVPNVNKSKKKRQKKKSIKIEVKPEQKINLLDNYINNHIFIKNGKFVTKPALSKKDFKDYGYTIVAPKDKRPYIRRSSKQKLKKLYFDAEGKLQIGTLSEKSHDAYKIEDIEIDFKNDSETNNDYFEVTTITKNGQKFKASISEKVIDKKTKEFTSIQQIQGKELHRQQDTPIKGRSVMNTTTVKGLHRSHLIANRFQGPGEAQSLNIILTSPKYNTRIMKSVEDQISSEIGNKLKKSSSKVYSFDMRTKATLEYYETSSLSKALISKLNEKKESNDNNLSDKKLLKEVTKDLLKEAKIEYGKNNKSKGFLRTTKKVKYSIILNILGDKISLPPKEIGEDKYF